MLIGDESYLPYDRPPLSKAVLLGQKKGGDTAFFPSSWFQENAIELSLSSKAVRIDRDSRHVELSDGSTIGYSRLLLATGSSIRPLGVPGADLAHVFSLREPHHAEAIAARLISGQTIVVIGAGIIGLEVAAAAVERGCVVHVLEAAPTAMSRALPEIVSRALTSEHIKHGVSIQFGVRVEALVGNRAVASVIIEGGGAIPCDAVVFGIGALPRTQLAAQAGLLVENGIVTDNCLKTMDDRIFACGDVCRYRSSIFAAGVRLENWRNAEDQAVTAARNMIGMRQEFDEVPWFWSNQYGFSLQVYGLPHLAEKHFAMKIGGSSIFLSVDENNVLRGASAFGSLIEIAAPLRKLKALIAAKHLTGCESEDGDAIMRKLLAS